LRAIYLFVYLFIFGAYIIKPAMISFNMMNYKDKTLACFVPIHFTCECSTDLPYFLWCTSANITVCLENAEIRHLKPVEMWSSLVWTMQAFHSWFTLILKPDL